MVVGAFPTHLPLLFPLVVILGAKRQSICSLPYDRMQYVAKTKPKNSRFLNSFTKIKQNRY